MPNGTGFSPSGRRTALGYWVPLALTVGLATLGVAAWIWSERNEDDDEEEYPRDDDDGARGGFPAPHAGPLGYATVGHGDYAGTTGIDLREEDEATMMGRMQGALRRTPSPQQIYDGASKRFTAGMAAAGAMMGGALGSIREENRGDFEDHSRWSEEVRSRQAAPSMTGALPHAPVSGLPSGQRKKTVAIVVSSQSQIDTDDFVSEHTVSNHQT